MIDRAMRTSRPVAACLLGLSGTLIILIAFWAGLGTSTELRALDTRFELTDAPLPSNILHIDIDDGSLEEIGRWPWPRKKLADIVAFLNTCQARAIMVDLILDKPQNLRFNTAHFDTHSTDAEEFLEKYAYPMPIYDDTLLATSMSDAKNVFLTMQIDMASNQSATTDAYDAFAKLMADDPNADLETVLKNSPEYRDNAEMAYLHHRSVQASERFAIRDDCVAALNVPSGRITPPLVLFTIPAKGIGCVTRVPDADDIIRRIPLFFRGRDRVYPQFAMSLAIEELRARHGGVFITSDKSSITIQCKDGAERRIPLDANGMMIIRWPSKAIDTPTCGLKHIPASAVLNIMQQKENRRNYEAYIYKLQVQFLDMGKELPENEEIKTLFYDGYREGIKLARTAYTQRLTEEAKLRMTTLYTPSKIDHATLDKLKRQEKTLHKRLETSVATLTKELRKPENLKIFLGEPTSPDDSKLEFDQAMKQAAELLEMEREAERKKLENEKNLQANIDELRPMIENKICMIGATGTGVPDFVPTPLDPKTPGVFVHSHIINTILSGNFVYPAGMLVNTLTILLAGIIVTLIAATRPVLQAAPLALLAAVGYGLLNILVIFPLWGLWLALVAPLGAMLVSFLFVTAFRQLTEERAKRHIRGMWAKVVSPALVEQILENPEMANPGGRNTELTSMFSDLAGFTPLSESLGPHKTVALLNRYFDGVTEIVQNQCGGYLNKFLGDGVFVLFGVPLPQSDHPSRALDAALLCQTEVTRLNQALADELGAEVKLNVRIGIQSGEAMFGNCGSTDRTDYTAIGDCINLSARLESANKFFGTKIIISQYAWGLCDRENIFVRPLGDVFITGVKNSLHLLEVVGPIDEVSEPHRQAVTHFSKALDLVAERNFTDARTQFQQADLLHPNDKTTQIYLDICDKCITWGSEIDAWPVECNTAGGVVKLAWPERT
jgi:CHASE2 domain-containing sensor protein/class 3 adenylate cyclase